MRRPVLRLCIHQVVSTEGVIAACTLLTSAMWPSSIWPVLNMFHPEWQLHNPSWLLTELPMFPVQILTSLALGFWVWRRFHDRCMFWVWIIPCLVLLAAFCNIPESHQAPFTYFFGSGCLLERHCFNQVALTPPVLTSIAYAVGGRLAIAFA